MTKYIIDQILNADIPDEKKNEIIAQELGLGNFEQPASNSGFWSGLLGTASAFGSNIVRGLVDIPANILEMAGGINFLLGKAFEDATIPQRADFSKIPSHLRGRFAFTPQEAQKAIPKEPTIPLTENDISNFIKNQTSEIYEAPIIPAMDVNNFLYSQIKEPTLGQKIKEFFINAGKQDIDWDNSLRKWVKKHTYEPKNLIESIAGGLGRAVTMFIDPEIHLMKYPMIFAGMSFLKSYKGNNTDEALINAIESGVLAKAFKILPSDTQRLINKEVQKKIANGMDFTDAVATSMKESKPLQSAIKLATIQIIPPLTKTMKKIYEGKDITLQDISNLIQSGAFGILWGYMASRTGDLGQLATELGAIGEGVSPKVRKQLEVMRRLTSYLPMIQEDLQNPEKDMKDIVKKIPDEVFEERLPSDIIEQLKTKVEKEVKIPENIVTPEYLSPEIQEQIKKEKGVVEPIPFDKETLEQIKPAVSKTGKPPKNWLTEEQMRNLEVKTKEQPPKEAEQQGKTLLDVLNKQPHEDNSIITEANQPPKNKIEEQFRQKTVKQPKQKVDIEAKTTGKLGIGEEKPISIIEVEKKDNKLNIPDLRQKLPQKLPERYFYVDSKGNKKTFNKARIIKYNDKEFVLNKEKNSGFVLYGEPSENGMKEIKRGVIAKKVIEDGLRSLEAIPVEQKTQETKPTYPNKGDLEYSGGERGSIPVKAKEQQVEVGSIPTISTKISSDIVSELKELGYKSNDIDKILHDKLDDVVNLKIPKENVSIKRNGDIKIFLPDDIKDTLNEKTITVGHLPIIKKTLEEKPQLQGIVLDKLMNRSYNGDVDFDIEKHIYPLIKDKNMIKYTEQKYKPLETQTQKSKEAVNIEQNLNIPQKVKEIDNSFNNRINTIKDALNKNDIDVAKKTALKLSQDIDNIYNDLDKLPEEDFGKYFKKYRNWIDTIRRELGDKYSELINESIKEENKNKIKEVFIDIDSLEDKDIDTISKLADEIDKLNNKVYFVAKDNTIIHPKDLVNYIRTTIGIGEDWKEVRESHLEGENFVKRLVFTIQRAMLNPRTLTLFHKPLERFYKLGTEQIEEKNIMLANFMRKMKDYTDLKDKRRVHEALKVGDFLEKEFTDEELKKGIDISGLKWKVGDKQIPVARLLKIQDSVIRLNDREIKAYKNVIDTMHYTYTLLKDFLVKMAEEGGDEAENIKKVLNELGVRTGYIPHERKRNYYVNIKDENGETVYNTSVSTEKQAILKINEFRKMFGDKYTYKYGLNEPTLSAEERALISQDIVGKVIDRALKNAVKDKELSEEQKKAIDSILSDEIHREVLNVFLQRGFGKRFLKRKNIPGYDVDGLEYIIGDYLRGMAGYISKLKYSPKYMEAMSELRQKYPKNKSYISWARNYVFNQLRNLELSDKIGAYIQSGLFIHYLGFRPMQFVLNVLQNFTNGMGVIGAEYKTNEVSVISKITKAMKDVITSNYTEEERNVIIQGIESGELTPIMAREFIRSTGRMNAKWNRFLDVNGFFLERSEEFNRKTIFLTDYRLQRAKGVSVKEAYKHAIEITRMVHYHYGRANRYEWLAGGSTAQVTARTLMTFQTWGLHYLSYLMEGFKRYGFGEGMRMLFDSFLMFELLGGITATPYLWQMVNSFGLTKPIKRYIAENKKGISGAIRRFLEYGLTGTLGVDLSSSLGVAFPSNFALLGAYRELQKAYNNADIDGIGRIFETFYPRAINDLIKTLRYVDRGVRNKYGTPLFKLEKGRQIPIKFSTFDAIIKILGGYPSHISRDLFVYYTAKGIVNYFDRKVRVLRIKMREAYNNRNMALYREYYKEYLQLLRQARQFGLVYGRQKTIKIKGLPKLPKIKLPIKTQKPNLPFREITHMPKNVERVERKLGY